MAGLIRPFSRGLWQPRRHKLISTSLSAGTGMHSAGQLALPSALHTLSFWHRRTDSDSGKTFWASNAGAYQLYNNTGGSAIISRIPTNKTITAPTVGIGFWHHYVIHAGVNFVSNIDQQVFKDGSSAGTTTNGGSSTELTTAGTHWILGDDSVTAETDDGYRGQLFDMTLFHGIIPLEHLNYRDGRWVDFDDEVKPYIWYRLDGQGSDAGRDSSHRSNHFIVEGGGVDMSLEDLPPGANEITFQRLLPIPNAAVTGDTPILMNTGSFTTAGQDLTITRQLPILINAASFTFAGQDFTLVKNTPITMDLASFSFSGFDPTITRALIIPMDLETFTVTGAESTITRALLILMDTGSSTFVGQDLSITTSVLISMDSGTFILNGLDPAFIRQLLINVELATFSFAGQDLTITLQNTIPMDSGSFSLSGLDSIFNKDTPILIDSASFTVAGLEMTISGALDFVADLGSFSFTGPDSTITRQIPILLDLASFNFVGNDSNITVSTPILMDLASSTLAGEDLTITRDLIVLMDAGSFTFTGLNAVLSVLAILGNFRVAFVFLSKNKLDIDNSLNTLNINNSLNTLELVSAEENEVTE